MRHKRYTKETVLQTIRGAAKKLGHAPKYRELKSLCGMGAGTILRRFASYGAALRAAGFEPTRGTQRLSDEELLTAWGQLVGRLQRIPAESEYARRGRFSADVLKKRFGRWSAIPGVFLERTANQPGWAEVSAIIKNSLPYGRCRVPASGSSRPSSLSGRFSQRRAMRGVGLPAAGAEANKAGVPGEADGRKLLGFRGFLHEPTNENGVLVLFGAVALELGILLHSIQPGFPDCLALRKMPSGIWRFVRIEFEYESRKFLAAGHPRDGCDLIVCWRHNWRGCPLEVLELRKEVRRLPSVPAMA